MHKKQTFLKTILWCLAPPRCPFCGDVVVPFSVCRECAEVEKTLRCLSLKPNFCIEKVDEIFCRWKYQSQVRNAILKMKFQNMPYYAENLILLLFCHPQAYTFTAQFDIIVPIPSTKSRRKERGYDVSFLLAKAVSESTGVLMAQKEVLAKVKETPNQVGLDAKQRSKNLKGAFEVCLPQQIKGKKVLIVDDVVTTGATAKEAAKVLKQAGANHVRLLVLAETMIKTEGGKESCE